MSKLEMTKFKCTKVQKKIYFFFTSPSHFALDNQTQYKRQFSNQCFIFLRNRATTPWLFLKESETKANQKFTVIYHIPSES